MPGADVAEVAERKRLEIERAGMVAGGNVAAAGFEVLVERRVSGKGRLADAIMMMVRAS